IRGVVAADRDRADAVRLEIASVAHDLVQHGLHEWAVIADEHDEQALRAAQPVARIALAVGCGELEVRRGPAEIARGGCCRHDDLLDSERQNASIAAATMRARLYCPPPLRSGVEIELPQHAAHHAARVLRLRSGDTITLFTGEGGEFD